MPRLPGLISVVRSANHCGISGLMLDLQTRFLSEACEGCGAYGACECSNSLRIRPCKTNKVSYSNLRSLTGSKGDSSRILMTSGPLIATFPALYGVLI